MNSAFISIIDKQVAFKLDKPDVHVVAFPYTDEGKEQAKVWCKENQVSTSRVSSTVDFPRESGLKGARGVEVRQWISEVLYQEPAVRLFERADEVIIILKHISDMGTHISSTAVSDAKEILEYLYR